MQTPTDDDVIGLNRAATVARLLAGAAHEVNNALLVIGGTAELLEDATEPADAFRSGLDRIRTQSTRAGSAIAEVLAFARDSTIERGPVDLREIAASVGRLRAYAINRAGLTVEIHTPERMRSREANRVLVQQAVLNLVINAEQALAGQRGGLITVTVVDEPDRASVRVADTGPGVPEPLRSRIFEPFFTTGDRLQSSGLGLTAARLVAERHGGTVVLEDVDAGASFLMTIAG